MRFCLGEEEGEYFCANSVPMFLMRLVEKNDSVLELFLTSNKESL